VQVQVFPCVSFNVCITHNSVTHDVTLGESPCVSPDTHWPCWNHCVFCIISGHRELTHSLRMLHPYIFYSALLWEMAWRQIGVKPFLKPMLISNILQIKEHFSVEYFNQLTHLLQLKYGRNSFFFTEITLQRGMRVHGEFPVVLHNSASQGLSRFCI